jgi:hypothetical protein
MSKNADDAFVAPNSEKERKTQMPPRYVKFTINYKKEWRLTNLFIMLISIG